MLKRCILFILLFVVVIPLLTSCWSRHELNEISIVSAIGIDYVDGKYSVTFQIINPQEVASTPAAGSGTEETAISVFTQQSPTLVEAIRETSTKVPRRIYVSHLQVVVIGESLAKKGLSEIVDVFMRESTFRPDFYMFTAHGKSAEEVLLLLSPLERIPASYLTGSTETSDQVWGSVQAVKFSKMVQLLADQGQQIVLPGVIVEGDLEKGRTTDNLNATKSPAHFEIENLAVYRGGKLVGWLDKIASRGFYFTQQKDRLERTVVTLECPIEGYINVEVDRIKPKIKLDVSGQTPVATLHVKVNADITELTCKHMDLEQLQTVRKIEQETEKEIESMIQHTVERAKEWDTDIFGIQYQLEKRKPAFWKKYKKKVDSLIKEVNIKIDVNATLKHTGKIGNPLLKEWED